MERLMDYTIKTVYRPEDLNGLYNAFLLTKKSMKAADKIRRIISTALAAVFWGMTALVLLPAVIGSIENRSMQRLLSAFR